MADVIKRARTRGLDYCTALVTSAGVRVGEFPLSIDWHAEEVTYRSGLAELKEIAEIAAALARETVRPRSDPTVANCPITRISRCTVAEFAGNRRNPGRWRSDIRLGWRFRPPRSIVKDAVSRFCTNPRRY